MARKRSRGKSLSQKIVGTAAAGMPAPVKRAITTRWGSRIALASALGLFGSGVVTVQWANYSPHLHVNEERAAQVKDAVVEQASKLGLEQADRRDTPGFFGGRSR